MTLDEFYKLGKNECFERIKQESRSQVKRRLCFGVVISLLIIAVMAFIVIVKPEEFESYTNNFYICILSVFCIAAVWFVVNNLRFLRIVDTLGAPKHLLYEYERTVKNNRYACYLFVLGCIGSFYPDISYNFKYLDLNWALMDLTFNVAVIGLWIYFYFKIESGNYQTRRDEEIIDRLQDLINMK